MNGAKSRGGEVLEGIASVGSKRFTHLIACEKKLRKKTKRLLYTVRSELPAIDFMKTFIGV